MSEVRTDAMLTAMVHDKAFSGPDTATTFEELDHWLTDRYRPVAADATFTVYERRDRYGGDPVSHRSRIVGDATIVRSLSVATLLLWRNHASCSVGLADRADRRA